MVVYGTGQVAGTVAADVLKIGDITVQNQGFGLVLQASADFLDISCDGLFVRIFPPPSLLWVPGMPILAGAACPAAL
jgi:hypothetical protein